MSEETKKAKELYRQFGFKKASFVAFDNMQQAPNERETDFWLRVVNQIAILDLTDAGRAGLNNSEIG